MTGDARSNDCSWCTLVEGNGMGFTACGAIYGGQNKSGESLGQNNLTGCHRAGCPSLISITEVLLTKVLEGRSNDRVVPLPDRTARMPISPCNQPRVVGGNANHRYGR